MNKALEPQFTPADIEILEEKIAYHGYFRIKRYKLCHRLFNGGWSKPLIREIFDRGQAVAVLLFDPVLNKIVLVEQLRAGLLGHTDSPWLLEMVAGIIDTDETPLQVARRETQEETGLVVSDLIPIYEYWTSPGGSSEKISLFCGRVDASQAGGIHGLAEEGEDIRVWVMDVQEVYDALATRRIQNALSIIAIQWFQLNETKVKAQWLK